MRCVFVIRCVCVLCLVCVGPWTLATATAAAENHHGGQAAQQGPYLLALNPPLLAEPLGDEVIDGDDSSDLTDETTAPEGDNASARPQSTSELTPADKTTDPTQDAASDETTEALLAPTDAPDNDVADDTEEEDNTQQESEEAVAETEPLDEQLVALRGAVRQTLASYAKEPFNTRDNTAANLLNVCIAYGCSTEVRRDGGSGPQLNGITCLCWNYPCAGYELLRLCDGRIAPRIGYGYQEQPGQLLAVLALSRVPREYPIRVGEDVRKVDDLVEYEKLTCRSGMDLSFKLIGLSRYLPTDGPWKNDQGKTWSISRIIREELARGIDQAPRGGTHRLLALSYAVANRAKRGEPIDGQYRRAKKYVTEFAHYALELQNSDGGWHPQFFTYRGSGGTAIEQINANGHILRWLVVALDEGQLRDARVVRAVARLNSLLTDSRYRGRHLPAASAAEIAARMNAVHALSLYDRRVFRPHDETPNDGGETNDVAAKPADSTR